MSSAKKEYKRITTKTLVEMKKKGEKIAMLTAYDYTMAKIIDHAGIDMYPGRRFGFQCDGRP